MDHVRGVHSTIEPVFFGLGQLFFPFTATSRSMLFSTTGQLMCFIPLQCILPADVL